MTIDTELPEYKRFISLGYFCSTALELERMGLRNESSPFDWLITSRFDSVIELIGNRFEGFLEPDLMMQSKDNPNHYKNYKYSIEFYHDFDKYHPLSKQIKKVQEKYKRRIERFYKSISEPTLFIRYINSEEIQGETCFELIWIEEHQSEILGIVKSFNTQNDILYVANDGLSSQTVSIFNVEADINDTVARSFLEKNAELREMLESLPYPARAENLLFYEMKQENKTKTVPAPQKAIRKIESLYQEKILHEYKHVRQY